MIDRCRCGCAEADHAPAGFDNPCLNCMCPEFRFLETIDSLTLGGTQ